MQWLLACFGYVKIPKEAITLAMTIEDTLKQLTWVTAEGNPQLKEVLILRLKTMRTITNFLRSGKLLNGG